MKKSYRRIDFSATRPEDLFYGTEIRRTGEKVTKDGYTWYKIVLPEGSDEAWIAGSLIGY